MCMFIEEYRPIKIGRLTGHIKVLREDFYIFYVTNHDPHQWGPGRLRESG